MYICVMFFVEEHQKPKVSSPFLMLCGLLSHRNLHFPVRAEDEASGRVRKAAAACGPSPPCLTHLVCSAEQMRQCRNSAASRDASGATARLVAGGRVLIIRANTRLCLCPQL